MLILSKWNDAACVNEYFSDSRSEIQEDKWSDDPIYKAVLDSKSADETLVRRCKYNGTQWAQLLIWSSSKFIFS